MGIFTVQGNISSLVLTYVPGVGVFPLFPVLSLGGCKFVWVVTLVVVAMYCFHVCVADYFTVFTVGYVLYC